MLHEEEDEHLCLQVEATVPMVKKKKRKREFSGIMAAAQQKAATFFCFVVSCFRTIGNKTIAGYYKQGEQLSVPEKTA